MANSDTPTPKYPPQFQAARAYKSNAFQGMSDRELMAQLYQKIINHLYQARDAYLSNNLEAVAEQNSKVIHIVDVLREELIGSGALKDPEAALPAAFLLKTYTSLLERVANVLQKKPVDEEFNAIIALVKPLYHAWMQPKADGDSETAAASGTTVAG